MPRPRSRLLPGALALCLCGLLRAAPARADGAFPNSESIYTPEALPHDIVLATNFGIVRSTDDGTTWTWACEQAGDLNATYYQLGPAPAYRIFAVASDGVTATTAHLAYSDDNACGWSTSGGLLTGTSAQDEFADPTNPNRVMVVTALPSDGGAGVAEVLESSDGGATFNTVRFTASAGDQITGLEIARSAPSTVYLTMKSGSSLAPVLMQSTNGGMTWTRHDLTAMLAAGTKSIRLIAVDPTDAQKVYLRVGAGQDEGLAVTTDGGATVTTPLTFPGGIVTSFTRMSSGTIVVGGVIVVDNVAFRSTDGGQTFQQLPNPPQKLAALSSRGTTLYGVADNQVDGYAVGISTDQGMSWQQFLRYDQITAIAGCLHDFCQTDCMNRAGMCQWPPDLCSAVAPTPDGGGGSVGAGGGGGATGSAGSRGTGGSGGTSADGGPPGGGTPSGCHCAAAGGRAPVWSLVIAAVGASLARARRSRRRRPVPSSKT
jgi:hypothetical protein